MQAPLFKKETGWFSTVNPAVAVIGDGRGAEAAVRALLAHPVHWVGEKARALEDSVRAYPRASVTTVHGQRGHFQLEVAGPLGIRRFECGSIVLTPNPLLEISKDLKLPSSPLIQALTRAEKVNMTGQIIAFYLGEEISGGFFALKALQEGVRFAELGCKVYYFYTDLPYALDNFETLYGQGLKLGIQFFRLRQPLLVLEKGNRLCLAFYDPLLPEFEALSLMVDILFVGEQFAPSTEFSRLAQLLRIQTDAEGFLQADQVRYFPIYTNRLGIYVLGVAKGSAYALQASLEAQAIAGELATFLSGEIFIPEGFARVDPEMCLECLNCYHVCIHQAVELDQEKNAVYIDPLACQGCGVCVAECPAMAVTLTRTRQDLKHKAAGRVRIYACENSGYLVLRSFVHPLAWNNQLDIIVVPCTGDVETLSILKALADGAKQVVVLGCHKEQCLNGGNRRSETKVLEIKEKLQTMGLSPEKVEWIATVPNAPLECREALSKILEI